MAAYPDLYGMPEDAQPSAPPLAALNYLVKNGSMEGYQQNSRTKQRKLCQICTEDVKESTKPFTKMQCGHFYHLECGTNSGCIDPRGGRCKKCDPDAEDEKKEEEEPERIEAEDEGIPIDHGDNSGVTRSLEERFGRQGIQEKFEKDESDLYWEEVNEAEMEQKYSLSLLQKSNITGIKNPLKAKELMKMTIDFNYLQDHEIHIDRLVELKMDILTLRYGLKIVTWKELMQLGLDSQHLLHFELEDVVRLYDVNHIMLLKDLDIAFSALVNSFFLDPKFLDRIGMNVDVMIDNGMNMTTMNKLHFPLAAWIKLGFRKEHLEKLNLNKEAIQNVLGWDLFSVNRSLSLSAKDRQKLNISVQDLTNNVPVRRPAAPQGRRQQAPNRQKSVGYSVDLSSMRGGRRRS